MSTTYQDAYDHMIQNVYAPVFFNKLAADYGLRPTTEQEARELLVLAGKLEQLEREHQTKQAQERTNVVTNAHQYLDQLLGRGPAAPASPNAYSESEVKQAAAELTQVDHLRDAALLFADYMRQVNG